MEGTDRNGNFFVSRTWTISDLAKEFGVTPRTIRFYEDEKLLTPDREGQNRVYSARDRARLAWILRGRRVGFSLAEITEMLDLYDLDDGRETQRQVTLEKCRDRLRTLESQRDDLDATIDELDSFCRLLEELKAGVPLEEVRRKHNDKLRSVAE
jgi:DNA-binding transcriptional MerR regulator